MSTKTKHERAEVSLPDLMTGHADVAELSDEEINDLLAVCIRFAQAMDWIDEPGGMEWLARIAEAGGPMAFRAALEESLDVALTDSWPDDVTVERMTDPCPPDNPLARVLLRSGTSRLHRTLYRLVADAELAGDLPRQDEEDPDDDDDSTDLAPVTNGRRTSASKRTPARGTRRRART